MGHRSYGLDRPDSLVSGPLVLGVRYLPLALAHSQVPRVGRLGHRYLPGRVLGMAAWSFLISAGSFFMYIESCTIGLPGLNEGWLDPPGILSMIIEAIFVALYLREARRRSPEHG